MQTAKYMGLAQIRKKYKEQFIEFTTSLRNYGALIPSSVENDNSVIATLSRFGDEHSSKEITISLDTESGVVTVLFAMSANSVIATKRDWSITYDSFCEKAEHEVRGYVALYMDDKFEHNVFLKQNSPS